MDTLQVGQDAHGDGAQPNRLEAGAGLAHIADHLGRELLEALTRQRMAAIERIGVDIADAHEKVSRKGDGSDLDAAATTQGHRHHREGDRTTDPARDDIVEVIVARVVVVVVATKAELAPHVAAQRFDA